VKLLLDLLPIVIFFGAFRAARFWPEATMAAVAATVGPIGGTAAEQQELSAVMVATCCAIVVTLVQLAYLRLWRLPIKPAVWISAVLIVVFGGLTVWLHNAWFMKWKPSILYWIFALVLLAGRWIWKRNLLGALLSEELPLPAPVWDRLMYAWAVFFLLLGAANLVVAYESSTDVWVNFKTFGLLGLTMVFSVGTGLYVARYLPATAGTPSVEDGRGSSDA